jgi:RHS repeat-associated protein
LNCSNITGANIRCLEYQYDQFSNLVQQNKHLFPVVNGALATQQATAEEFYAYDDLQRLTSESRFYAGFSANGSLGESYSYDKVGDILTKSDFGNYTYGSSTADRSKTDSHAGPHAVESVAGGAFPWQYTYDMNGNMTSDGQRNVTYDDQDRPVQITLGNVTTIFRYTPDGDRYLQRTINTFDASANHTVYYVDKVYERIDHDTAPSEETTYCGKSTVIEQRSTLTAPFFTRDVRYLHLDRLGSTEAVTAASGAEVFTDGHGYDAFGKPRGREWLSSNDQMHGQTTRHGFTGHEQLDETFLTHMNGRIYDYRLGRFLSVDPLIGNPLNTQSINPYSYGGNNPLSGVDPTGYAFFGPGLCDAESGPCSDGLGGGATPPSTHRGIFLVITTINGSNVRFDLFTLGPNGVAFRLMSASSIGQLSPDANSMNTNDLGTSQGSHENEADKDGPPMVPLNKKVLHEREGVQRAEESAKEPECVKSPGCTRLHVEPDVTPKWDENGRLASWTPDPRPRAVSHFDRNVNPDDPSAFGRGTTNSDIGDHNTTLEFHESKHMEDAEWWVTRVPLPQPPLKVGMTEREYNAALITYGSMIFQYRTNEANFSERLTDYTPGGIPKPPPGKSLN